MEAHRLIELAARCQRGRYRLTVRLQSRFRGRKHTSSVGLLNRLSEVETSEDIAAEGFGPAVSRMTRMTYLGP